MKVLAIIPCYNEASAIRQLLAEFRACSIACDVLVIDDGSSDNTAQIAGESATVIRFETNQGVMAVIKEGLRYARDNQYDFCIQIDGDGQHNPADIPRFLAAYQAAPADMLIGSRYVHQLLPLLATPRKAAGLLISSLLYLLFRRQWVYDPTSGMRMLDGKAIAYLHAQIDASMPDASIVALAMHGDLSIAELPVVMRPRLTGTSHVAGWPGVIFLLRVIGVMLAIRLRRAPVKSLPAAL